MKKKLIIAGALAFTINLFGKNVYWQASGAAPASGGDGIWDRTTENWTSSDSSLAAPTFNDDDNVFFGVGQGTVTLTTSVNAGTVTFSTQGYSINTLANNAAWNSIAGNSGFSKQGSGTITISAESSASGVISINDGILKIASQKALGTSTLTVNPNGVFDYNGQSAQNIITLNGGSINNGGSTNVALNGNRIILNENSKIVGTGIFPGTRTHFQWNGGVLNLNGHTLEQAGARFWVNAGGITIKNGTYRITEGIFNGFGNRTKWDASSNLSIDGGIYDVGGSTTIYNMSGTGGTLAIKGSVNINQNGTQAIASTITGTKDDSIVFAGDGTTTLSAANTYIGKTMVNGGKLIVTGTLQLNSQDGIHVTPDAELSLNGIIKLTSKDASISNEGILTIGGVLDLNSLFDDQNPTQSESYHLISGTISGGEFSEIKGFNKAKWSSVSFDKDMGLLTFVAVPEPSKYSLLCAGFFLSGGVIQSLRRRNRNQNKV